MTLKAHPARQGTSPTATAESAEAGFIPNVRPGMRYRDFEAEVVRAARYGANLPPAEEDATVGDGLQGDWQEAEVIRGEGEDTDLKHGGHAASTLEPLSEEKADAVKEAMKGFALPAEATPAWAAAIPESDWIKALAAGAKGGDANIPEHMLAALGLEGKSLEPVPMFKK